MATETLPERVIKEIWEKVLAIRAQGRTPIGIIINASMASADPTLTTKVLPGQTETPEAVVPHGGDSDQATVILSK